MIEWIPNFIKKTVDYRPHDILTAKELNALLNLIITQGDYNSEWLDYLQNHGIPDAVADLTLEEVKESLNRIVEETVAALAASVRNKTSAALNKPTFAFLNTSVQADMRNFKDTINAAGIPGSFCIATNLVGQSSAYPTLLEVQALNAAGHELVPVGTSTAPITQLTVAQIEAMLNSVSEFYNLNNITIDDTFLYPNGTTSDIAVDAVNTSYRYGVDISAKSFINSDLFLDQMMYAPVVDVTNSASINALKEVVDTCITNNYACIFKVDTSSTTYSATLLNQLIEYVSSKEDISITTVSGLLRACEHTINNNIKALHLNVVDVQDDLDTYTEYADEQFIIVNNAITDVLNTVMNALAQTSDALTTLISQNAATGTANTSAISNLRADFDANAVDNTAAHTAYTHAIDSLQTSVSALQSVVNTLNASTIAYSGLASGDTVKAALDALAEKTESTTLSDYGYSGAITTTYNTTGTYTITFNTKFTKTPSVSVLLVNSNQSAARYIVYSIDEIDSKHAVVRWRNISTTTSGHNFAATFRWLAVGE